MSEPEQPAGKRTRSPAYPALSLKEAIARAAPLWEKAKRHAAPLATLCGYWGFEGVGSQGNSAVSALLKFGLVDAEGTGDGRMVKLTEMGVRLCYNPDKSSAEYRKDIHKAAFLPEIHQDIWAKYGPSLPDNEIIERYLVIERKFNDQYVKGFIRRFRETIDFAGALGDIAHEPTQEGEIPFPAPMTTISPPPAPTPPPSLIAPQDRAPEILPGEASRQLNYNIPYAPQPQRNPSLKDFNLPTPAGDILIRGPFPMSEADFNTFVQAIQVFRPWMVKTGPAIEDP